MWAKIWSFILSYWDILLLVATWGGIVLVAWRKRRDWKRKRFVQQVNFSLNYIESGTLRLRTLMEDRAERVWLNDYGVKQVLKAASATTEDQPFLRLRSAVDMDQVKRAVVNVLSERFAEVFVARSLGAPVRSDTYVFGVTWERYGAIRSQKLRVILMRQRDLAATFGEEEEGGASPTAIEFEVESHRDRLTTLRKLYELEQSGDDRDRRTTGIVELGVPDVAAP